MFKNKLLILFLFCLPNFVLASDWASYHEWPEVGQTRFKVLFFKIYDIELRTPTGLYKDLDEKALGIKIRYLRDIPAKKLLDSTAEQWDHLGIPKIQQEGWLNQLKANWPDIQKGDEILYVSNTVGGSFYHCPDCKKRGKPVKTGSINDAAFHQAFLSIWLSPNTYYAKARQKLLKNTLSD